MPSANATEAAHLIDRLERLARSGTSELNPAQWEALRFLGRANRFSRTPAALADYLASTRGTVSQTLIALEQKGYVERRPSARDGRSIDVHLTRMGERTLRRDPLIGLAREIEHAAGERIEALVEVLASALRSAIARNGGRAFGVCHTCRYFRRDATKTLPAPHHCALLDEPLSDADSQAICAEQQANAA